MKKFLPIPLLLVMSLSGCHIGRYFYWNVANIDDYKKFENAKIPPSKNPYTFPEKKLNLRLPDSLADFPGQDFKAFLEAHKTVAFILIKNDTIIHQSYHNDYHENSLVTSFSVAKSFVSAMTGIAIEEGYIKHVDEPITNYLDYLDEKTFGDITITHLLNMRSGLKASEGYINPFSDVAKYYYGKNLSTYLKQIKKKEAPGQTYEYLSLNTQLLAAVIESATGKKIQEYFGEKLWQQIGTTHPALWSVDSKKHQTVKAFCCLNAKALDFAKFGVLYLNNGKWGNKQVVPDDWVQKTMQIQNNSRDSQGYPYAYQWRTTEYGASFAKGIKGQYIYVYPEKNVVAVRFGTDYGDIDWADFIKNVIEYNLEFNKKTLKNC